MTGGSLIQTKADGVFLLLTPERTPTGSLRGDLRRFHGGSGSGGYQRGNQSGIYSWGHSWLRGERRGTLSGLSGGGQRRRKH